MVCFSFVIYSVKSHLADLQFVGNIKKVILQFLQRTDVAHFCIVSYHVNL